jgi:GT2 family glycosyltransferase
VHPESTNQVLTTERTCRGTSKQGDAALAHLPDWALVLSTYRRPDVLMLCLRAALEQTRAPSEVIVVDASPDWLASRAAVMAEVAPLRPGARWHYVEAERRSLPAQRNQGIALATAPILFMIDDDSLMYPDCAAEILKVYAADTQRKIAGVGAQEVAAPPPASWLVDLLDAGGDGNAPPARVGDSASESPARLRRRLRWNLAQLFDRGPGSFLPYEGRWPDKSLPRECAHLRVSPARALNGFRMTFRREVITSEGFLGWFIGYAPLEDLDATYRASRHGVLVNAHAARLCHLVHHAARPNHYSVAAQWVMSSAVLHAVFGHDRQALARAWRRRVRRFLLLELVKDLAKRRFTLPNFRGILHGARHLSQIYRMTPDELRRWYPRVQSALMNFREEAQD